MKFSPQALWDRLFPLKIGDRVHVHYVTPDSKKEWKFDATIYKVEENYVYVKADYKVAGLVSPNWIVRRENVSRIR